MIGSFEDEITGIIFGIANSLMGGLLLHDRKAVSIDKSL
jgi:hypothetical protein